MTSSVTWPRSHSHRIGAWAGTPTSPPSISPKKTMLTPKLKLPQRWTWVIQTSDLLFSAWSGRVVRAVFDKELGNLGRRGAPLSTAHCVARCTESQTVNGLENSRVCLQDAVHLSLVSVNQEVKFFCHKMLALGILCFILDSKAKR